MQKIATFRDYSVTCILFCDAFLIMHYFRGHGRAVPKLGRGGNDWYGILFSSQDFSQVASSNTWTPSVVGLKKSATSGFVKCFHVHLSMI